MKEEKSVRFRQEQVSAFSGNSCPLSSGFGVRNRRNMQKLSSDKTILNGKTNNDYVVNDSLYTYFVVNSVATVGLFLNF